MKRTTTAVVVALLLPSLAPAAAPPFAKKNAKADLEAMAKKLPFFMPREFAIDNDHPFGLPEDAARDYERLIRPLRQRAYSEASLVKLLKHRDAKVRTLAAAGLLAHENPINLRHLEPLLKDNAGTFLTAENRSAEIEQPGKMPPLKPLTVAKVARIFLELYLIHAGYTDGVAPDSGRPGLKEYWAERKGRTHCASWFAVRLCRAVASTSPTPADRMEAVRAVRRQIERLPKVDRVLTLLWLYPQTGGETLISERELVDACKSLGPAMLLDLLRREVLSTDPDLAPGRSNYMTGTMIRFVLRHSDKFLRAKDADAILECEAAARKRDDRTEAEWFIAAARLQPKRAAEILQAGWEALAKDKGAYSGDERLRLTLARWRMVREEGPAVVVKRFYDEPPQHAYFPHCRAQFLRGIGNGYQPRDRQLLAALVRDKRFDSLDWQSLENLARVVNSLQKKPVIDPEELRQAWHPLGMGHFEWSRGMADKTYPKQTQELLRALKRWREQLRNHFAQK